MGLLQSSPSFDTDALDKMDWDSLHGLRTNFAGNMAAQQVLAPFEHQAYAREAVQNNPLNAIGYSVMIPAYQAAKTVGLIKPVDNNNPVTPPSLAELLHGFRGVKQGLIGI